MSKRSKANYHIFRVEEHEDDLPTKITMTYIYAKDDDDAYSQLKEYTKIANKQYKYYVEPWSKCIAVIDGKKYEFNSLYSSMQFELNSRHWFSKVWSRLSYYVIYWPSDLLYKIKCLAYLMKHKQEYSASWSIDFQLIKVLEHNLPILAENKHTLSWTMLAKAYMEEHPEVTEAEALEKVHNDEFNQKMSDRAQALEQELFKQLIQDIEAYKYYSGEYMYVDKKDSHQTEVDKRLRSTLPLIKGSYDRYDSIKLSKMTISKWNKIWETVRKYGMEFND